jgi:uncharacterized protein YcaQ
MTPARHPLPLDQARRLALHSQALAADPAPFGQGKPAALRALEHLGYVQVDTLAVVERAHHHILWSRVPDYLPARLEELHHQDRQVFEYWTHAAAYLPMKDYRFSLPVMRQFARGGLHWFHPTPELESALPRVLAAVRRRGPLQVRDFDSPATARPGAWGFTKIEKRALHELWMRGQVMIRERAGFQKIFDLPARVLPPEVNRRSPSPCELTEFLIRRALRTHGVVRPAEIRYLLRFLELPWDATLQRLVKRGEVVPVRVEGATDGPAYAAAAALDAIPDSVGQRLHILSPFDPLLLQRKRLHWLFGFEYQLECYVPAPKRRFGHFTLPLLWGDRFVGRLEARADRDRRQLEVSRLWWEPSRAREPNLRRALEESLARFAAFNRCPTVSLAPGLRRALA